MRNLKLRTELLDELAVVDALLGTQGGQLEPGGLLLLVLLLQRGHTDKASLPADATASCTEFILLSQWISFSPSSVLVILPCFAAVPLYNKGTLIDR